MSLESLKSKLGANLSLSSVFGVIERISATTIEISGLRPSIGDIVQICAKDKSKSGLAMVTEVRQNTALISPFGFVEGYKIGDFVYQSDQGM